MNVLTVRLNNKVSKKIDSILEEFNYSTKTDFVRDAIRTKIVQLEKEKNKKNALKWLEENFGKYKDSTLPWEESEKLRRQAGEEFIRDFEKKHGLK